MRGVIANAAWLTVLALPISACGAPSSYMGIDLGTLPRSADQAEVQVLAKRAQGGDKQAQLALGIRYEEGRGLPIDYRRAKALYVRAAQSNPGSLWIYSPAAGKGTRGRVISVDGGSVQSGLREARLRLRRLKARE
jgi:TPR repeat protein